MPESRRAQSRAGQHRRGHAGDAIARRIAESGPIPFTGFMEAALYAPQGGYYTSGRQTWGPGGDYITSLDVSPVFARTLGRQLAECWELLGSPSSFELVEAGAGRGWLSMGMLEYVKGACPGLYDALAVKLVELGGPPEAAMRHLRARHARQQVIQRQPCGEAQHADAAVLIHRHAKA
ncbi:MAG: hypothetical protein A2052_01075 [Deltaproteobacteria bacterium GWA2_54_12]|nr:MAG: hypothetical protein A2052_01075 [Deltaproteobacteria bacterium GWA2_54_12]